MSEKCIVVGIGGAGCNAIKYLSKSVLGADVACLTIDTEKSDLEQLDNATLLVGESVCKCFGANGDVEKGKKAAESSSQDIRRTLIDYQKAALIFGAGRGTGSGAGPVIFRIAKEIGMDVIVYVIRPFHFEANARITKANQCLKILQKKGAKGFVLDNDAILKMVGRNTSMQQALNLPFDYIRHDLDKHWEIRRCQIMTDINELVINNEEDIDFSNETDDLKGVQRDHWNFANVDEIMAMSKSDHQARCYLNIREYYEKGAISRNSFVLRCRDLHYDEFLKADKMFYDVTPEQIMDAICDHFDVTKDQMLSKSRKREIEKPRQIMTYLCYTMTDAPKGVIGDLLGGRSDKYVDHGISATHKGLDLRKNHPMANDIEEISNEVKGINKKVETFAG